MICQRCRCPLQINKSLQTTNVLNQLLLTHSPPNPGSSDSVLQTEDLSFIMLAESMNPYLSQPQDVNGTKPNKLEEILDYTEGHTSLDLVLCTECADSAKQQLKIEHQKASQTRDMYQNLLNEVQTEPACDPEEILKLQTEVTQLETKFQECLTQLKQAETAQQELENELKTVNFESEQLSHSQQQVYAQRNSIELDLAKQNTEYRRFLALLEYQTKQLQLLKQSNVYLDVFDIQQQGPLATINGLRLGRLKDLKIDWSEINAALGQLLFLLATLLKKLNLKVNYKLKLLGSMSKIEKLKEVNGEMQTTASLDLFSNGDYSFERLFYHKKLDAALVAMLDILNLIGQEVESRDENLKLPYTIVGDKIGNFSVRLSASSNESWSTALKYVLANAKWILAYVQAL